MNTHSEKKSAGVTRATIVGATRTDDGGTILELAASLTPEGDVVGLDATGVRIGDEVTLRSASADSDAERLDVGIADVLAGCDRLGDAIGDLSERALDAERWAYAAMLRASALDMIVENVLAALDSALGPTASWLYNANAREVFEALRTSIRSLQSTLADPTGETGEPLPITEAWEAWEAQLNDALSCLGVDDAWACIADGADYHTAQIEVYHMAPAEAARALVERGVLVVPSAGDETGCPECGHPLGDELDYDCGCAPLDDFADDADLDGLDLGEGGDDAS